MKFFVLFKKHQTEIATGHALLEGSSESEKCISWKYMTLKHKSCWLVLDFGDRGGGVCAFLACEEHLLSQPHQERQLLEGVQVLSRSAAGAKEGSWLLVILMGWNGKWEASKGPVSWHKFQPLNYGLAHKMLMALRLLGHGRQNPLLQ